jgi:hypothetical protein
MTKKLVVLTVVLLFPVAALADPGAATYGDVAYNRPLMDVGYNIDQYEGEGHHCIDLMAQVYTDERLTTMSAVAYFECALAPHDPPIDPQDPDTWPDVCCGTFWDHPTGGVLPPNPALFAAYGLMEYDGFWTCPEDWPNTDLDPTTYATSFAPGSPTVNPCVRFAEWYTDPEEPNVDGGLWTIARYNYTLDCSICPCPPGMECVDYPTEFDVCCWLIIEGDLYYASTGGLPWPYSLAIPVCWCIPEPGSLGLLALGALALIRRR